ncbi:MAG: sulfatase-like hydrolase/transferase, partial [Proteobacteria bacterium]|nr:sulfatase-like hydrolase/transferase [Pseudomonadota bacterium]
LIIFWLAALLFSTPFAVSNAMLGTNEMEPILIFFKDNQFDDIKTIGLDGFKGLLVFWGSIVAVILWASYYLIKTKKHAVNLLAVIGLILLVSSPFVQYVARLVLPNAAHQNFDLATRLQAPVITSRPDRKKNLVIVYLESVERSYGDIPEFDRFYKPLKDLAARGVEFTNVQQVTGTNYTIAGIVATHCGVPLLPDGLESVFFQSNLDTQMETFMPSVRCLGDVLSDEGYTLSYMNGASLDKFSKRAFLKEHGYTRFFDYKSLSEDAKKDRMNVWGLNDALLFENVIREYDTLKSEGAPFALSLLTLSTHGPDAFLDQNCPPAPGIDSQLPRAIECTSLLVTNLVDHITAQGDTDNTVVVVLSDHLALFNSLRAQLETIGPDRRNLFIMLGADAPSENPRPMSSFDHYPSILEGLGYGLKEGRANFGVSANSPDLNLMEELGQATINKTFKANQKLASFLWRP